MLCAESFASMARPPPFDIQNLSDDLQENLRQSEYIRNEISELKEMVHEDRQHGAHFRSEVFDTINAIRVEDFETYANLGKVQSSLN